MTLATVMVPHPPRPVRAFKALAPVLGLALLATGAGQAVAQTPAQVPGAPGVAAGPGYRDAETAFAALERRDFATAVPAASRALEIEPGNRSYRLALVDAHTGAGQHDAALAALQPLRQDPAYDVQSRLGSTLGQVGDHAAAAEAFAAAATAAPTLDARAYAIRARVLALIEGGDALRARAEFMAAVDAGLLEGSNPLDIAVIAVAVGEDEAAQPFYAAAAAAGDLDGRTALDAGYSARRAHRDAAAIDYFSRGIASVASGDLEMTPQGLFDVRRDVSNLDRTWGASGSLSYGASAAAGLGGLPTSTGSADSLQAGVEVYRRIGGYRAGAPFDVFARAFQTLDASSGATGSESLQGWLGVRWKPLTGANLVLEGSRMIALGDAARDDWMVRASWSREQGTDMRMDRSSWPLWRVYADVSHILNDQQTFGVVDARAGRSFAVSADRQTVVSAFGSLAMNYDSGVATPVAVGAGPGLSVRRWFGGSAVSAPRSYLDLSMEYRFRLGGDERAEGLFATLSVSF